MKFKYIILSLLFLSTVGCNDSFLDKAPKDQLTDESYWSTIEDVTMYTTSLYAHTLDPVNYILMTDSYTDNAVPVHIYDAQGQISSGTATSTTRYFAETWKAQFKGIRRCNVFFENIDRAPISEEKKQVFIGEVKFLRAFFYTTLVRLFGGVPIMTRPLDLNEAIPPRNSAEEVYDFIVKDLDEAAQLLPLQRTEQSEIGRATKGAALSLKAILSTYYNKYDVAAQTAKQVMDLGVYGLVDNYEKLFQPAYENSKEVIFDHQYLENAKDMTEGSLIDQAFGPQTSSGWEALSPTQDLVDAYSCTDGKPIGESPLYNAANPYENRDPRLGYTILWEDALFAGKPYKPQTGSANATRTGYTFRKYINPDNDGCTRPGWTNFIYMRYAEILLSYAEAQNEVSGPDQSVYDAVNQIRQRPSVEMPPLPAGLTKEQMREAIRQERRIEFAFEGIRLLDTRHWRITEEVVKKPVYGAVKDGKHIFVEQRKFNPEKDYLWAIPLNEINLSKGVLVQNPGY